MADFKSCVSSLDTPPETVFVTVDSRHVRRSIQLEGRHRIIDASTTDVRGVVVHSNVLPTENACLACIYRHVPEEHARERSIAEGLGVDLTDVRVGFITEEVARRIVKAHPNLDPTAISGLRLRQPLPPALLGTGSDNPRGPTRSSAPFAFVSAWAGVLMAIEMVRSFHGIVETNYWSVDPWNLPIARGRTLRPRHPDCQFCSKREYDPIVKELWGVTKAADAEMVD